MLGFIWASEEQENGDLNWDVSSQGASQVYGTGSKQGTGRDVRLPICHTVQKGSY